MLRTARLGTRDLDRARLFYDAVTAPLGASRVLDREELTGWQADSGGMLVIGVPRAGEATVANGSQVVLEAPTRAAVDSVHAEAMARGGTCEGPPGLRGNGFYAAYFRDLDGNKLVVACTRPE
jgi:catechol 2,3-dioxygenase-like lactoylglutathione lyase family enzyme